MRTVAGSPITLESESSKTLSDEDFDGSKAGAANCGRGAGDCTGE